MLEQQQQQEQEEGEGEEEGDGPAPTSPEDSVGHSPPLPPPRALFARVMLCLDLWLLRRQVDLLEGDVRLATPARVSSAALMLRAAGRKVAALLDDEQRDEGLSAAAAACESARARLDRAIAERCWRSSLDLELPAAADAREAAALAGRYGAPEGVLPAPWRPDDGLAGADGFDAARARTAENLGRLPVLPATASFADALAVLGRQEWSKAGAADASAQLRLSSIEALVFWHMAARFDSSGHCRSGPALSLEEMTALWVSTRPPSAAAAAAFPSCHAASNSPPFLLNSLTWKHHRRSSPFLLLPLPPPPSSSREWSTPTAPPWPASSSRRARRPPPACEWSSTAARLWW